MKELFEYDSLDDMKQVDDRLSEMCRILDSIDVYKLLLDSAVTRDKRALIKNLNFSTL